MFLKPITTRVLQVLGILSLAAGCAAAQAGDGERRVTVLVANPALTGEPYEHSVVLLSPEGGGDYGVIINRPTEQGIFVGGPFMPHRLLALTRDEKSLQLAAVPAPTELSPERARYFAGLILWRPGELSDELRRGVWIRLEIRLDTVFRGDTDGLWEELLAATQGVRV